MHRGNCTMATRVDLSNPVVKQMLQEAWLVVIRARAERMAKEEEERGRTLMLQADKTQ